ncbi:MAG: hypothetical protein LBS84_06550, partial [Clostridiales bacterium]|nr:hypothetical protein [Clostridiales bacterium]
GYISVFAYSDRACGVSVEGLKYGLTNAVLESSFPLGVSNEFVGRKGRVCVREGVLLIICTQQLINLSNLIQCNKVNP